MKKLLIFFIVIISQQIIAENKEALIVAYTSMGGLVVNDFESVRNKFTDIGFNVRTLSDPSVSEIEDFLGNLQEEVLDDTTVIFYYIGYGTNIEGQDFILDKHKNSLSINSVISDIYKTQANKLVVFADFYQPEGLDKEITRALKVVSKKSKRVEPKDKQLGYISSYNLTNSDDSRSPFSKAFERNVSIPNSELLTLFSRISDDVGLETMGLQKVNKATGYSDNLILNYVSRKRRDKTVDGSGKDIGSGTLKIYAMDPCVVSLSNNLKTELKKGGELELELKASDFLLTMEGGSKKQVYIVPIKANETSYFVYEDYGTRNEEGIELIKEDYSLNNFYNQFVEVKKGKIGKLSLDISLMVSRYEITQRVYDFVMGDNPSSRVGDNLPVDRVSLKKAILFCNKLSELAGYEPVYNLSSGSKGMVNSKANGYRLPTTREFDYLSSGDDDSWIDNKGRSFFKSEPKVQLTGMKKANSFGIHDLEGNVSEWTLNYKKVLWKEVVEYYQSGGNVESLESELQTHIKLDPKLSLSLAGFRVVRSVSE